jgi:hypothetical protein
MIKAGHRLALELDTPFHIHVAEEMFEVDHGLLLLDHRAHLLGLIP